MSSAPTEPSAPVSLVDSLWGVFPLMAPLLLLMTFGAPGAASHDAGHEAPAAHGEADHGDAAHGDAGHDKAPALKKPAHAPVKGGH